MRIQVTLDSVTGTLTIYAEGCTAATPPARLAATLAGIVEAALTEPPAPAPARPARRSPGAQQPLVDQPAAVPDADTAPSEVTEQPPMPVARTPRAATDVPVAGEQANTEVVTAARAEVVTATTAALTEDHEQDEPRRSEALQLLDDGVPDHEICAKLKITRSRLLRWDDPDREHRALTESLAGVSA